MYDFFRYIILLFLVFLIMTEGFLWHRKDEKKKHVSDQTAPPVFDIHKNPIPLYKSYELCISDFFQEGSLLQLHCTATNNHEIIRGFSAGDLHPFEKKVRTELKTLFERLGDNQTEQTCKIWYYPPDFDTHDIPLQIAITFYKPVNWDKTAKTLLTKQIHKILQELLDIDWKQVNDILETYCIPNERLMNTLNEKIHSDFNETKLLDSSKKILKSLYLDMCFFYDNQYLAAFYRSTIFENLKTKYTEIDDCYLEKLQNDYTRDTVF